MTDEEKILKNKTISETKRNTIARHQDMSCKTFDVKIQHNAISVKQKEALERIFLEQKWYKNYILNWCESSPENRLSKFDTRQTAITKKDKDMNDVNVQIQYLSAQSRQCLLSRMLSNAKTIKTLTSKRLQKGGHLRFSKEETIIDLKQYGTSHKIVSSRRIKVAGIKKPLPVNGLKQFIGIDGIEYANARLIHRPNGYYIQFVCYVPKETKESYIDETIGVDFGCETSFTLSNGEKIDVKVRESDRLKRLQRDLSRKVKGSKNFNRCVVRIRKEYQKVTNRKLDVANKIVHKLSSYKCASYRTSKSNDGTKGGHGKSVQHSILGKVKAKLKLKPNVAVLDKYVPTTKVCTVCGQYHDEIKLWDRVFKCDCGVCLDRDVHAARNMVWFYENNVGVGRTDVKRVEMRAMIDDAIRRCSQPESVKREAPVH